MWAIVKDEIRIDCFPQAEHHGAIKEAQGLKIIVVEEEIKEG